MWTARIRPVLRRLRRRVFRLFGSMLVRPAFRVGLVIIFLALVSSWALHLKEQDASTEKNWPYATYVGTIEQVGILLLSGFDAEPPTSPTGFVLAMFCLFLGFGLLALITADLASVLVTAAMIDTGRLRLRAKRHIVILGWHDTSRVLVNQLTHRDETFQREVVIIDDHVTSLPTYDPDVRLLHGDPTTVETLRRANLSKAYTAIVPIDWNFDESLQDSHTTLAVMAIKSVNPKVYTCAEILKPHNKRHVERTGVDETVCVGELSEKLLSQAVLTHGLARLIERLLTFSAESEIYLVPLPEELAGVSFRWLLRRLNKKRQALPLAVQRGDATHTNPRQEFLLEKGDRLFILSPEIPDDLDALAEE